MTDTARLLNHRSRNSGRKPFGIGLALCLLLAPAAIASPPQNMARPVAGNQSKPLDQTNLVAFTLCWAGDLGSHTLQVWPDGQVKIVITRVPSFRSLMVASHITPSQLRRFFLLVNRADFPHLKQDYRNMNIMDAGSSTATVTYVDRPGHQKTLSVYDYAGVAPLGFEDLQRFLWNVIEAIVPPSRFDKESVSTIPVPVAPPPLPPPPPHPTPPPPPPPKPTAPER